MKQNHIALLIVTFPLVLALATTSLPERYKFACQTRFVNGWFLNAAINENSDTIQVQSTRGFALPESGVIELCRGNFREEMSYTSYTVKNFKSYDVLTLNIDRRCIYCDSKLHPKGSIVNYLRPL